MLHVAQLIIRRIHPALAGLDAPTMVARTSTAAAPLHPAAAAVYKELGFMK